MSRGLRRPASGAAPARGERLPHGGNDRFPRNDCSRGTRLRLNGSSSPVSLSIVLKAAVIYVFVASLLSWLSIQCTSRTSTSALMTVASMSFAQKAARVARLLRPFGAPQLQAFAPPAETGYRMRSEFCVYVSARLHDACPAGPSGPSTPVALRASITRRAHSSHREVRRRARGTKPSCW